MTSSESEDEIPPAQKSRNSQNSPSSNSDSNDSGIKKQNKTTKETPQTTPSSRSSFSDKLLNSNNKFTAMLKNKFGGMHNISSILKKNDDFKKQRKKKIDKSSRFLSESNPLISSTQIDISEPMGSDISKKNKKRPPKKRELISDSNNSSSEEGGIHYSDKKRKEKQMNKINILQKHILKKKQPLKVKSLIQQKANKSFGDDNEALTSDSEFEQEKNPIIQSKKIYKHNQSEDYFISSDNAPKYKKKKKKKLEKDKSHSLLPTDTTQLGKRKRDDVEKQYNKSSKKVKLNNSIDETDSINKNKKHQKSFSFSSNASDISTTSTQQIVEKQTDIKKLSKLCSSKVNDFERDYNLTKINDTLFKRIKSKEEAFILHVPKKIDPELLIGKRIYLHKNTQISLGNHKYDCTPKQANNSPVALYCSPNDIRTVLPAGTITIQRHLKTKSIPQLNSTFQDNVFFPDDLKQRHPLFGSEYEDKINLDDHIQEKLKSVLECHHLSREKAKKKKKKDKHMEKNPEEEEIFKLLNDTTSKRETVVGNGQHKKKKKVIEDQEEFYEASISKKKKKEKRAKKEQGEGEKDIKDESLSLINEILLSKSYELLNNSEKKKKRKKRDKK